MEGACACNSMLASVHSLFTTGRQTVALRGPFYEAHLLSLDIDRAGVIVGALLSAHA